MNRQAARYLCCLWSPPGRAWCHCCHRPQRLPARLPTSSAQRLPARPPARPAGYLAQSVGLLTTDASRASFLSTFTVLVVPFLAGISGRGVSPVTWASCLAAMTGVGLLEQSGAAPGVGDVWSLVSAVFFGVQVSPTGPASFCSPSFPATSHACELGARRQ